MDKHKKPTGINALKGKFLGFAGHFNLTCGTLQSHLRDTSISLAGHFNLTCGTLQSLISARAHRLIHKQRGTLQSQPIQYRTKKNQKKAAASDKKNKHCKYTQAATTTEQKEPMPCAALQIILSRKNILISRIERAGMPAG